MRNRNLKHALYSGHHLAHHCHASIQSHHSNTTAVRCGQIEQGRIEVNHGSSALRVHAYNVHSEDHSDPTVNPDIGASSSSNNVVLDNNGFFSIINSGHDADSGTSHVFSSDPASSASDPAAPSYAQNVAASSNTSVGSGPMSASYAAYHGNSGANGAPGLSSDTSGPESSAETVPSSYNSADTTAPHPQPYVRHWVPVHHYASNPLPSPAAAASARDHASAIASAAHDNLGTRIGAHGAASYIKPIGPTWAPGAAAAAAGDLLRDRMSTHAHADQRGGGVAHGVAERPARLGVHLPLPPRARIGRRAGLVDGGGHGCEQAWPANCR